MAEGPQNQGPTGEQQHQSSSSSPTSSYSETEKLKKQTEAPFGGFPIANGDIQMIPIMYPSSFPGSFQLQQIQEQVNHGRGIYAVAPFPFMGHTAGYPPNALIPFTYNLPTQSASDNRAVVGDAGQLDHHQQQQQQQPHPQHPGAQRQVVVRRFQIAFQLDLLLILKLAAVIFLFNPDGSKQRLVLLVFFALVVYLYQTGALAPLVRWLSQGMHRAAMPPRNPPRPPVRADNDNAAGRAGNENAAAAEAQPGAENQNQPADDNRAGEQDRLLEPGPPEGGNRWWGIVKEIQIIVFGFITSLLPGFHNIEQ